MKICATTLGETLGDLLSMTLKIGYAYSSIIVLTFFLVSLFIQLSANFYKPFLYWFVIVATSTVGTTCSDFMNRTLELGYANGSLILSIILVFNFFIWKLNETSLSVINIKTVKGEIFYWVSILISNTLGTSLGDFITEYLNLGFFGGVLIIGSLLLVIAFSYQLKIFSETLLFWLAFVLTRPFGATFGDLLTKSNEFGGLNIGTISSTFILSIILGIFILLEYFRMDQNDSKIFLKN
jgi:uncharacterized membrane-anchored protein